jgi:hypothetical protein
MIGHGRPITAASFVVHALAATVVAACAVPSAAAELDVRLRFAWGSGGQAPQRWTGGISVAGGEVSDLQPLGNEADEVAALRLDGKQVVINPLAPRIFDGCDVTLRGDEAALVSIRLHNDSATEAKEVQAPLGELARAEYRARLDELGGFLLVNRTPGDTLRVDVRRAHVVYEPGETISLTVTPHLDGVALPEGPLTLDARLAPSSGGAVAWEDSYPWDGAARAPITLELPAPAGEGAFRLSLALRGPAGLTTKLRPWQPPAPVAAREIEFVVIDPAARQPQLAGAWDDVQTINPADVKWWRRVPEWTQLDRLPGLTASRSLGNVKPVPKPIDGQTFMELPVAAANSDPSWQAYSLSVREVGAPHVVEVELPADERQQLAVSVIEADASGRVQTFGREAGVYVDSVPPPGGTEGVIRHRITFWPRTATPLLLLANQSAARPALYGTIRLQRERMVDAAQASSDATESPRDGGERLIAAYISAPRLAECLGAAEMHDAASGLSVDGWATFLAAAQRLVQELKGGGYNAAIVSIAADGSSLAPIPALGGSPRYDTGLLAASGSDPLRKDVLEALLRVFDREGMRLIPAIELATPLPRLEAILAANDLGSVGVACVGLNGRPWSDHHPGQAAGARYNILDPQVQAAVSEVVDQLITRDGEHAALGGIAVQLSGRGYGVLPGLRWGLDDATTARFAAAAKIELPAGAEQFAVRAATITGPEASRWLAWRRHELTKFYAGLASRVAGDDQRQLVLCTENLFAGAEASQRLRMAVSGRASLDDAAAELGIDFAALADAPGICLLRSRRLASDEALQARALDLQLNNSAELDGVCERRPQAGEMFYHASQRLRLASFDAQSPFGPERTYLSMGMVSYPYPAAARQPAAMALAARDFFAWVEGGELLPLVRDEEAIHLRRLFSKLPGSSVEVRTERLQPATLRVYRDETATTMCLINESPWPIKVTVPVEVREPTPWRELGVDSAVPSQQAPGDAKWEASLPAYGVAGRQYETKTLRVGAMTLNVQPEAKAALAARIQEIEQRMPGLDVERSYSQLQNPGFELTGADGLMLGWQPRVGAQGLAAIDDTAAAMGSRALHLRSHDAMGVAAQTHLFAIPATGQLTVRSKIRARQLAADAAIHVWIEYDAGGAVQQKAVRIDGRRLGGEWTTCDVAFDDLPFASSGQMRVLFHLAGAGEAWIDGVELFDLRFTQRQRMELSKDVFSAKQTLAKGQLADCQRIVDGFWPRYLVEYLPASATPAPMLDERPPTEPPVRMATQPEGPTPAKAEDDSPSGFGGRLRSWFK